MAGTRLLRTHVDIGTEAEVERSSCRDESRAGWGNTANTHESGEPQVAWQAAKHKAEEPSKYTAAEKCAAKRTKINATLRRASGSQERREKATEQRYSITSQTLHVLSTI